MRTKCSARAVQLFGRLAILEPLCDTCKICPTKLKPQPAQEPNAHLRRRRRRRRRGFEPRFVRSSRGSLARSPPPLPFSIPLHHRYRRWMGGVSRPRIFLSCPCPRSTAHKTEAPGTAHLQQCPPSPVTPADGSRISSSYSSSACRGGLEPGSSGLKPATQPLQHAAENRHCGH